MKLKDEFKKLRELGDNNIEQDIAIIKLIDLYYDSFHPECDKKTATLEQDCEAFSELQRIVNVHLENKDNDDPSVLDALISIIIKIITSSHIDKNCSLFNQYFKLARCVCPDLLEQASKVEAYIKGLWRELYTEDIFVADSLMEVGENLYKSVKEKMQCGDNAIKIALQRLHLYPLNKRSKPVTDEDYYTEIVAYLEINKLPSEVYRIAREHYQKVQIEFSHLIEHIDSLESQCCSLLSESNEKSELIKAKRHRIIISDDVREDRLSLLVEIQRRKELETLYMQKDEHEGIELEASSYLEYCRAVLNKQLSFFLSDKTSESEVEQTLKQWTLRDVRQDTIIQDLGYNSNLIANRFVPYLRFLEQLTNTLSDNPTKTIQRIRLRIKGIPFIHAITEKHQKASGFKLTDTNSCEYQRYVEEIYNHPSHLDKLLAIDDGEKYLEQLEMIIVDAIAMIRNNISSSLCLKKRKCVLEKIVNLFENGDFDVIVNMIPIQIEGLFADYLENSLLYETQSDLNLFEQIYRSVLKDKTRIAILNDLNLGFDTIGYFQFYFNSVYRNTVAHGNYRLLFNDGRGFENLTDEQTVQIIAHELILDLCYIIDVIVRSNELDEAKSYLSYTEQSLMYNRSEDGEPLINDGEANDTSCLSQSEFESLDSRFVRLYLDLLGESRYNYGNYRSGFFVSHDPIQLIYWIFNPLIADEIGISICEPIRKVLLSTTFWRYVEYKLNHDYLFYDKTRMKKVVQKMMYELKNINGAFEIAKRIFQSL